MPRQPREERDPRLELSDPRDLRDLGDPKDPRDRRVLRKDPRDARAPGDPRDARTVLDLPETSFSRQAPAGIISGAYALLGVSLWLESDNWSRTPSYAILLDILPQQAWGSMLIILAVLLAITTWITDSKLLSLSAHYLAIFFTAGWMIAFIVRYLTDPMRSTTPMNPITWAVLLAVLMYSTRNIEKYRKVAITLKVTK